MAVTSGYFNSVNGDRKYNADQMSEYFEGIINEGVCQHIDGGLAVTAGTGLSVSVAAGKAFIGQKWIRNDASLTLTIGAASTSYARIDAVVIRRNNSTRTCEIAVKAGTPAASPESPSMTRTDATYEMALAYVNVAAGASSVTVTDKRSDSSVCGWAAVAQATSGEVDQMLNDMKTGFDGVVYPSPAAMVQGEDTKLQTQINGLTRNGQHLGIVSGKFSSNGTWPYMLLSVNARAGDTLDLTALYFSASDSNIIRFMLYNGDTGTYIKDFSVSDRNLYKFTTDMNSIKLVVNLGTAEDLYFTGRVYVFGDKTLEDIRSNRLVYENYLNVEQGQNVNEALPLYANNGDVISLEVVDSDNVLNSGYQLYIGYKNGGTTVNSVMIIKWPYTKGTCKIATDFDQDSLRIFISGTDISSTGKIKFVYKNLTKLGIEPRRKEYSSFSILGDSYSTFKGYTTPENNAQWYPANDPTTGGYDSGNDVNDLANTWWYKLANDTQLYLKINASYSGSTIGYDSYGPGGADGKTHSFIQRAQVLENSSLLFIFGGTNDDWAGESIGEYKYSDWTEDDLSYFAPAVAYLINDLKSKFIGMDIVFIMNDSLGSSYKTVIDTVCGHYSVPVIHLENIAKIGGHPSVAGMVKITDFVKKYLANNTAFPYYE